MRQTLFLISFGQPFAFWTPDPASGWPQVGVAWIILVLLGINGVLNYWKTRQPSTMFSRSGLITAGVGILLTLILKQSLAGKSIAVYGYGFLVMIGFLAGVLTAERRLPKIGLSPDIAWDAGMWLLGGGVVGARLFYLLQYGHQVYRNARTFGDYIWATVDLTGGGLVLIGGLLGGGLGFLAFCKRRQLSMADLADAFTPSMFLGIGFGRIGCLLNGCCFGDRCELPWGLAFPKGSVPFKVLEDRGFVLPTAPFTMPLHPTQIYSAIDGFLLFAITAVLFRERRWKGEVFGWGCVMYSFTRFLMEFLRGDEMGQLGTGLTISQLYSLGIAILGSAVLVWHTRRTNTLTA